MNQWIAYLQMALGQSLAGSSVVSGKFMVAELPIFGASVLRYICALVVLIPLTLRQQGGWPRIRRQDMGLLLLQSFTGSFLFSVFLLFGLRLTSGMQAGMITSLTPAVLGLIAFVFLREQPTKARVIGILFTVLGVMAVNVLGGGRGEAGARPWLGNLLVFGAAVGEALFTIFRKLQSDDLSPLATAMMVTLLAFFMFLPWGIPELLRMDWQAVSWQAWTAVVYGGAFSIAVAFICWFAGVRHAPASSAAIMTGMLPLTAVLLSWALLGETFTWAHALGIACVLAGIACMARGERQAI